MKAILFCLPLVVLCSCSHDSTTHAADKAKSTGSSTTTAPMPSKTMPPPTASTPPATTPPSGANVSAGETAADRELADRVRQALRDDEEVSDTARQVTVSVRDGKVTLRGTVPTKDDREMIETSVKAVTGVTHVDDLLEVRPG